MDHETTAGSFPVDEQTGPEQIRQNVEDSLDAADGDLSPLTGLEDENGQGGAGETAGQAQKHLGDVKAQVQERIGDVAGAAQEKAAGAKEAVSGAAGDLLGKAKGADPASAATQAWRAIAKNPVPATVGGAFLAGVVVGRRGRG